MGVPLQVMLHAGRVLSVLWWALDPHRITTTCDDQTLKVRARTRPDTRQRDIRRPRPSRQDVLLLQHAMSLA